MHFAISVLKVTGIFIKITNCPFKTIKLHGFLICHTDSSGIPAFTQKEYKILITYLFLISVSFPRNSIITMAVKFITNYTSDIVNGIYYFWHYDMDAVSI